MGYEKRTGNLMLHAQPPADRGKRTSYAAVEILSTKVAMHAIVFGKRNKPMRSLRNGLLSFHP